MLIIWACLIQQWIFDYPLAEEQERDVNCRNILGGRKLCKIKSETFRSSFSELRDSPNNQFQLPMNTHSFSILINTSTRETKRCLGKVSIFAYKYFTSSFARYSFSLARITKSLPINYKKLHVTNYQHPQNFTPASFNFPDHTHEKLFHFSNFSIHWRRQGVAMCF